MEKIMRDVLFARIASAVTPIEKSSNTNRKSTTSFPMSGRGGEGLKTQSDRFSSKIEP